MIFAVFAGGLAKQDLNRLQGTEKIVSKTEFPGLGYLASLHCINGLEAFYRNFTVSSGLVTISQNFLSSCISCDKIDDGVKSSLGLTPLIRRREKKKIHL